MVPAGKGDIEIFKSAWAAAGLLVLGAPASLTKLLCRERRRRAD